MSKKRIMCPWGTTFVHLTSRAVDRDFKFEASEDKSMMRDLLRRTSDFSGVRVLTFAFMSNHFHILAAIPQKPEEIPSNEVLRRIKILYEDEALDAILQEWDRIEEEGGQEALEAYADRFRRRMYDMGEYMKTYKQRVTQRYNKIHKRDGTLWEKRYYSNLIQGDPSGLALRSIAAYIDLNPVRCGIVDDPACYKFTGYGEAMSNDKDSQNGLKELFPPIGDGSWEDFDKEYRKLLYVSEEDREMPEVAKRIGNVSHARYPLPLFLRQTIRCLTDGLILGDKDFVNRVFQAYRGHFGPKRKTGARSIPYCPDWQGQVYAARDLRKKPITILTG